MEATPAASSAPRALERRHGKWTQAECDYAMLLIEHFTSGRLPGLLGGESLRTTLSECLACTPMRVTKKLSSTHAIGKCVFKLRGSLTNDERQALDAARRAFLASVEPRRRPSGEPVSTPQILPTDRVTRGGGKRSRDDDAPTDQLIAPASQTLFTVTHLAPHDANERQPVETSVLARVNEQRRTAVRIVMQDRPGLLGHMSRFFARRNLTILAARCETLAGGVLHDEFEVVDATTRRPVADAAALAQMERDVLASLKKTERDKSTTTTLSVSVPDRPGLLKRIVASLDSLSLNVVGAKISTVVGGAEPQITRTAVDTFDVVDARTGAAIVDAERLRSIEAQLAADLRDVPDVTMEASSTPPPPPPGSPQISTASPGPSQQASPRLGPPVPTISP